MSLLPPKPKILAMIPARMGSQRLKAKNLRELGGIPLITRAIRKCKAAGVFDEIWVNSENDAFKEHADIEEVGFHHRPEALGSDTATSEQFVHEFLLKHPCDYVVQVHSIAPLLTAGEVASFVRAMAESENDVMLSCIHDQIECAFEGRPINFTFAEKTNSQELTPIQRITWSVSGWKRDTYVAAFERGDCATYAGKVGFYPVNPMSGHVIKTQLDLDIAESLLKVLQ